jgi:hypothetical protein
MAKLTIQQWLKNIWDAAITGGCGAALAAAGLAGAHTIGIQVQPLDYKQTGAIFLSGMIWDVVRYLRLHPSPDIHGADANEENENKKPNE